MHEDIEKILIGEDEIKARVAEAGAKISRDFAGKDPIFVGVLKGCFIFMADLMRYVDIQCSMDFMAVSSYSGTSSTGAVKINKDLSEDIEGRHLIIVEDILDSGVTLSYLKNYLMVRKPASISIVTLMDKPARRMSMPITPALRCRTLSSSATGSTITSATATCRISACSSRRYTPEHLYRILHRIRRM